MGKLIQRLVKRLQKGHWKRHTGAVVVVLYFAAKQLGIEVPAEVEQWVPIIGELLWGVGWLDKFRRVAVRED